MGRMAYVQQCSSMVDRPSWKHLPRCTYGVFWKLQNKRHARPGTIGGEAIRGCRPVDHGMHVGRLSGLLEESHSGDLVRVGMTPHSGRARTAITQAPPANIMRSELDASTMVRLLREDYP